MKTKISFLTLIFSLSAIVFLISSCLKDEAVHLFDPNLVQDVSTEDTIKPVRTLDYFSESENEQGSQVELITNSLSEYYDNVYFAHSTNSGIAVESFVCSDGGATLVVYNPSDPDYNFFNNPRQYEIYWLRGGELAGTRARLDCVCPGKYSVTVIDKVAQIGIGRTIFLSQASCDPDELPTSGTSTGNN